MIFNASVETSERFSLNLAIIIIIVLVVSLHAVSPQLTAHTLPSEQTFSLVIDLDLLPGPVGVYATWQQKCDRAVFLALLDGMICWMDFFLHLLFNISP